MIENEMAKLLKPDHERLRSCLYPSSARRLESASRWCSSRVHDLQAWRECPAAVEPVNGMTSYLFGRVGVYAAEHDALRARPRTVVQAPELGRDRLPAGSRRQVEELSGGLTNVNLKVTTRRDGVGRRTHRPARQRAARHRPRRRAAQLRGAPPRRASAPRSSSTSRTRPARRRLHRGPHASPTTTCATAGTSPGRRGRAGSSTRGRASSTTSTCSRIQPRYLDIVHERGFRLPDRYDEFADQAQQIKRRAGAPTRRRRCRATTTCSPATSSTTARRSG